MNKGTFCYICKKQEKTRPYGVKGQWICFGCIKSSPELEAEAKRNFDRAYANYMLTRRARSSNTCCCTLLRCAEGSPAKEPS